MDRIQLLHAQTDSRTEDPINPSQIKIPQSPFRGGGICINDTCLEILTIFGLGSKSEKSLI